jgi:hypothetical protein
VLGDEDGEAGIGNQIEHLKVHVLYLPQVTDRDSAASVLGRQVAEVAGTSLKVMLSPAAAAAFGTMVNRARAVARAPANITFFISFSPSIWNF